MSAVLPDPTPPPVPPDPSDPLPEPIPQPPDPDPYGMRKGFWPRGGPFRDLRALSIRFRGCSACAN